MEDALASRGPEGLRKVQAYRVVRSNRKAGDGVTEIAEADGLIDLHRCRVGYAKGVDSYGMCGGRTTGEVSVGIKGRHSRSTSIYCDGLRAGGARLIHAHIVTQYICRTRARSVRGPRKAASDGEVQQDIERMVEDPLRTCRDVA